MAVCLSWAAAGERTMGPLVPPSTCPTVATQPGDSALLERLEGRKVTSWKEPLS